MPAKTFLIEEMIEGGVAELLVGVTLDPAHGYVLTLAAGGVLTELLQDSVSLLVPSTRDAVAEALTQLKAHALLTGFRGKPAADIASVIEAVMSIQAYVIANAGAVSEVEVNPLICTPTRAVAADALIRKAKA
jgi:acetyl-CoA synthetase